MPLGSVWTAGSEEAGTAGIVAAGDGNVVADGPAEGDALGDVCADAGDVNANTARTATNRLARLVENTKTS